MTATNAPGIGPGDIQDYKLRHELGHFMGKSWPAGTPVRGYPYPNDPNYLEIITPDDFALTVQEGIDVERYDRCASWGCDNEATDEAPLDAGLGEGARCCDSCRQEYEGALAELAGPPPGEKISDPEGRWAAERGIMLPEPEDLESFRRGEPRDDTSEPSGPDYDSRSSEGGEPEPLPCEDCGGDRGRWESYPGHTRFWADCEVCWGTGIAGGSDEDCQLCGEPPTPERPVRDHALNPRGWRHQTTRCHSDCADNLAADQL